MKKYRFIDDDGKEYSVVEEEEKTEVVKEAYEAPAPLTDDEILALRRLAKVADRLVEMSKADKVVDACKDEDEEEDDENEKEVEIKKVKKEEIADTDEEELDEGEDEEEEDDEDEKKLKTIKKKVVKATDSKASIGAIERRAKVVDNSLVDETADAWAERYKKIQA